ncbi:MAG: hypothetical protein Q8922_04330 [Bacteroidota bacterium]|nr:hypothetical protein [Bacteroidota bacterium]MDP4231807.1 hypothetical protein [Bacteroidota bacterium]MDP4242693.1 hypothetical protein [Bacteroidota bacterium]MDP4287144.1 hypothetical protein [Bacteroidota bacterium]
MIDIEPSLTTRIHSARRVLLAGHAESALETLEALGAEQFASYHLVRAECCYALHRYADARDEAAQTLELAPNSPRAEILLQLCQEMIELDRMVQPPPAMTRLQSDKPMPIVQSVPFVPERTIDPEEFEHAEESGLVSETLAEIMTHQGKFEEARKIYIQLSRLDPGRDAYYHEKIQLLSEPGLR